MWIRIHKNLLINTDKVECIERLGNGGTEIRFSDNVAYSVREDCIDKIQEILSRKITVVEVR